MALFWKLVFDEKSNNFTELGVKGKFCLQNFKLLGVNDQKRSFESYLCLKNSIYVSSKIENLSEICLENIIFLTHIHDPQIFKPDWRRCKEANLAVGQRGQLTLWHDLVN